MTLGIISVLHLVGVAHVFLLVALSSLSFFFFFLTRHKTTRNYFSISNKLSHCPFDHLLLHCVDIVKRKTSHTCSNKSSHKEKEKKIWGSCGGDRVLHTVKEEKQGPSPGQAECCESQVEQLTAPRRWLNTYTHVTEIPPPKKAKQNNLHARCVTPSTPRCLLQEKIWPITFSKHDMWAQYLLFAHTLSHTRVYKHGRLVATLGTHPRGQE